MMYCCRYYASCPLLLFFFFNDTATTEIYTLSLHDALPISLGRLVCEPLRVAPRADALPLVGSLSLRHLLVLPRGSARRRRTLEPLRVAAPAELLQPDALQREHRLRDERERHSDQRRGSLRRDRTADLAGELRQALRLGHPQRRRQPVAEPDQ